MQSRACQRKDWKKHKYECSPLPIGQLSWPVAVAPEQADELEAEVRRVASILGTWENAFKPHFQDTTWEVSQLPENRLISGKLPFLYDLL